MQIKQDPVTGLWARQDGAVLMPPCPNIHRFKHTWTFGYQRCDGYCIIGYKGKYHLVHRIICRAFHGLPPEGKPEVDHINRIKVDNRSFNLRYVDRKGNNGNTDRGDRSIAKYGVRWRDDLKGYRKAYAAAYAAEKKARGLCYRKGPDGKHGWYPRIHTTDQDKGVGVFHCNRSSFDGLEYHYRPKVEVKVNPKIDWDDFVDVSQFQELLRPRIDSAGRLASEWERHLLNECLRLGIWRLWFVQWYEFTETAAFMVMKVFPPWEIRQAQALAKKVGEHIIGLNLKRWLLMPPEQFLRESGASPNRDVMMEVRRVLGERCRRKCK